MALQYAKKQKQKGADVMKKCYNPVTSFIVSRHETLHVSRHNTMLNSIMTADNTFMTSLNNFARTENTNNVSVELNITDINRTDNWANNNCDLNAVYVAENNGNEFVNVCFGNCALRTNIVSSIVETLTNIISLAIMNCEVLKTDNTNISNHKKAEERVDVNVLNTQNNNVALVSLANNNYYDDTNSVIFEVNSKYGFIEKQNFYKNTLEAIKKVTKKFVNNMSFICFEKRKKLDNKRTNNNFYVKKHGICSMLSHFKHWLINKKKYQLFYQRFFCLTNCCNINTYI